MNAKVLLQKSHRIIVNAIEALPEADWYLPGVAGDWSVKDVLAHMASYELVLLESLKALIDNSPAPTAMRSSADPLAFNDTEIARRRGRSAQSVWGEYEGTHLANLKLIARVPAQRLRVPGLLEWFGEDRDLEDFITHKIYGHKREHGTQIQIFKEQLSVAKMNRLSPKDLALDDPVPTALSNEFDLNQVNAAMMTRLIHWMEA
jgi:hypothetical protein